ncbi:MAG: A/G-specific adenine glycosylase [Pseudomonadota bacterium]
MDPGLSDTSLHLNPQDLSGQFVLWRKRLQDWYADNRRNLPWRKTLDPYTIWVSEVMLQQTQVKTVIAYHDRFLKRFPSIHSLACADQQDVLKLWEGLGYYSRARNFHKAAIQVTSRHSGQIPADWNAFRQLPGVGDYIASAVLSIAFNQPFAVVDGNVKRVISRLFAMDTPVNSPGAHMVFQEPATALLDRDAPGIFNQAMMELGALICKPSKPLCTQCPLHTFCAAFASRQVDFYPKRVKAMPVPLYPVVAGVVYHEGRMLITKRKSDGLLGGLWEFPGGKILEGESPADACVREIWEETGVSARIVSHLCQVKHGYTHFKIQMQVFICHALSGAVRLNGPVDFRWITPDDMDLYPFPGANHKFLGLLKDIAHTRPKTPPTGTKI